ncbi:ORF24 [White spot syndrome virus]|uniref:Wsv449 n=3 Tax=White spot syndrome virus TaxID=342409 RepID=Q8VAG7_WSSVS|nr:wsv449 [Shrimp white spot syndrome virus]AFX59826.1 wsv449 [White spot syndrome virus]AAL33450.1 wsv449 [Shrimp white spot syndrome virus]AAL89377.1 WSSV509 [Shrimp white spot syndrome virus]ATU83809.1 ORF24 [White spot syndrome virus]AWQ60572.1 wsv449 [Shrimp white spot syndrome virus]
MILNNEQVLRITIAGYSNIRILGRCTRKVNNSVSKESVPLARIYRHGLTRFKWKILNVYIVPKSSILDIWITDNLSSFFNF